MVRAPGAAVGASMLGSCSRVFVAPFELELAQLCPEKALGSHITGAFLGGMFQAVHWGNEVSFLCSSAGTTPIVLLPGIRLSSGSASAALQCQGCVSGAVNT